MKAVYFLKKMNLEWLKAHRIWILNYHPKQKSLDVIDDIEELKEQRICDFESLKFSILKLTVKLLISLSQKKNLLKGCLPNSKSMVRLSTTKIRVQNYSWMTIELIHTENQTILIFFSIKPSCGPHFAARQRPQKRHRKFSSSQKKKHKDQQPVRRRFKWCRSRDDHNFHKAEKRV